MPVKERAKLVIKQIALSWKKKTKKEKEEFAKRLISPDDDDPVRAANVIDITEYDERTPRITKCLLCGKVCLGEQMLMKHLETMHSTEQKSDDIPREDYNTSDDADTEELLIEDESTELELDDIVEGQSMAKGVELVLVKAAKRFRPVKRKSKK